jgi:isoquinoline 1-oxidoreductase beta subunit
VSRPAGRSAPSVGAHFDRRHFLSGAGAAGFTLAFAGAGTVIAAGADAAVAAGAYDPAVWYRIEPDGTVIVHIIRAEMGQHVGTAIARILIEELEADWATVRLEYVDSDAKWGLMVTGGSWSVWQSFPLYSRAGAAGRMALIEEGAKLLGVSASACHASQSMVISGSRSIGYDKIVQRGRLTRTFTPDELAKMPIKPAAQRRAIGIDTQAIDIPGKIDGKALYGIDYEVPGMVYARPKMPPTRNGSVVTHVDDAAARKIPGYQRYLVLEDSTHTISGWVLAIADNFMAAVKAADALEVTWASDDTARVSEQGIIAHAGRQIADPTAGILVVDDPGVDDAFGRAATTLERRYTTSSVLHFQLEPVNCVAYNQDGIWHVHTGNQWQSLILPTLGATLGVDPSKVIIHNKLLGGGFGRRLNGDYIVPTVLASKALGGRPVKLVLMRPDDARFDSFRSPSLQRVKMAFDADGRITGMQHDAGAGWPTQVMAAAALAKGINGNYDPFAIAGADSWYTVGAQRVRALSNDVANRAFRPGWLRSVSPGWVNWASESFIDEAAAHLKTDPVALRLRLLDGTGRNAGSAPNAVGGALRQAAVVRRAAEKAGWGRALPADTGLGLATTFGQERDMPTWVACVARVRVDRRTGVVTIEKLTLVVDAGTLVHPDGALAQTEGGALWGVSMALNEGTEFIDGQVKDRNLDTYTPLRMADVPDMDIEFLKSTEVPVGLGEPGVTAVAPAVGNAIFAAVGVRMRALPMRPADILAALATAHDEAAGQDKAGQDKTG